MQSPHGMWMLEMSEEQGHLAWVKREWVSGTLMDSEIGGVISKQKAILLIGSKELTVLWQ